MKKSGKKKNRPGEPWQLINVEDLLEAESEDDIVELPLKEIDPFADHPFKVLDDEMMQDLAGSIRRNGILTPVMVRTKPDGRYEMISGHRRMRAAEILELETIPAFIRDMDDIDAVIVMVDANLKREKILPSEMAFAFQMRYEALKKKAGIPGVSGRVLNGRTATKAELMEAQDPKRFCIRSDLEMAAAVGMSRGQLQRYLRLTELIPEFLEMVDLEKLPLMTAVDISFIGVQAQKYLCEYIRENGMVKSYQVTALRKYLNNARHISRKDLFTLLGNNLTGRTQSKNITLTEQKLQMYFSANYSLSDMEKIIYRLLDNWKAEEKAAGPGSKRGKRQR